MPLPSAIGYLRSDVSGQRQVWDENQIRSLAKKLGYDLRKTVVFSAKTDRPTYRLRVSVSRLGVDAVFVPSLAHFGGEVPDSVNAVAAVVIVSGEQTYARHPSPEAGQ